MTAEQCNSNLKSALPLLDKARLGARAYVGWLLVNPTFCSERDQLLTTRGPYIDQFALPGIIVNDGATTLFPPEPAPAAFPAAQRFAQAWRNFYIRWQLDGMAGPLLPVPVMSHYVGFPHGLSLNRYRQSNAMLSLAPTSPLPDAETFRQLAENGMGRRNGANHLSNWYEIVKNGNRQRARQIERYARIATVAHCWRVLIDHYGRLPKRTFTHLIAAFADHLNIPVPTVGPELRMVGKMADAGRTK